MISVGSVFSGAVDGMSMGFMQAGYDVQIANEIDKTAIKTASINYKHKILQSDIRDISCEEYKGLNVFVGTFPCVEYTRAANIHKKGRETNWKQAYHWAIVRDLFLHYMRFIALNQPDVWLFENSPDIRKFPIVIETFRKLPPYDVHEFVLDTLDFNLPQKRKRLFLAAFKKPYNMPSPLLFQSFDRQLTIKDIKEKEPQIHIPDFVKSRIDGAYRDLPSVKGDYDLGNTCVAHYARDCGTTLIKDSRGYKGLRPFTVREYARLMGIPDSFEFANERTTNFKHIGNSVSPVITRALAEGIKGYFM